MRWNVCTWGARLGAACDPSACSGYAKLRQAPMRPGMKEAKTAGSALHAVCLHSAAVPACPTSLCQVPRVQPRGGLGILDATWQAGVVP